MKRTLLSGCLAVGLLVGADARGQGRRNFDATLDASRASVPAPHARVSHARAASWDAGRGVPTFLWTDRSALEPPFAALATPGPEALALVHMRRNASAYQLPRGAQDAAYVRHVHDTGRGGIVVTLGQRADGVDVFETEMHLLLDRAGALVAIGGNLHPAATPRRAFVEQAFAGGPARAVATALNDAFDLRAEPTALVELPTLAQPRDGYAHFAMQEATWGTAMAVRLASPARAKRVLYPLGEQLVPAYYVEVEATGARARSSDLYGYVVAEGSARVLMRRHLVHDDAFAYRVWADPTAPFTPASGPHADFGPHPTGVPDATYPAYVEAQLVSVEGLNHPGGGAADPWLPEGATVTAGNNVDAYADVGAPDGFTEGVDIRPTTTGPHAFDHTYRTDLTPGATREQLMASATAAFYVTNWLHDYFYDSGFDETAGNAQASNFDRGGVEGDAMRVEVQDNDGANNSNMSTPADGAPPRLQLYRWTAKPGTSALALGPTGEAPEHTVAAFGPTRFGTTAPLALAGDACAALTNDLTGRIALLDRGACAIESQVLRAQQAGAVGALVTDAQDSSPPSLDDDAATFGVTIGAFGIASTDALSLEAALAAGVVTATMTRDAEPAHDGALDQDIVAHEWGHHLHHRLVTCSTDQCGGESEGWGDFNALLMKVREGDDVATGTFAVGVYSAVASPDPGYFGLRRFPYSRDMAKNGLTLKHLGGDAALPAGPQSPNDQPSFEVHNAGEVWASMLFQAYTELLLKGGRPFDEIKRRMADYVVAGMELAPANPTLTEQRDALLAVAAAVDGDDVAALAKGFAARGAGSCAVAPARASTAGEGVVEDFALSGQPALVSAAIHDTVKSCDDDGVLDVGELGHLHLVVRNAGGAVLPATKISVKSTDPALTFHGGSMVVMPALGPQAEDTVTLYVSLDRATELHAAVDLTITLESAGSCAPTVTETVKLFVDFDDRPESSTVETFDSEQPLWTVWSAPAYAALGDDIWARERDATGNYRFHGQDFPAHSDTALVSPELHVGEGPFVVTFAHAHDFESSPQAPGDPDTRWDGGLVELSTDGGLTWRDASLFADPGYDGVIADIPDAANPLGDRPAYVGQNPSYPATDPVKLDFGTALAGETVKLRFRIGTDVQGGTPDAQGWYLDDIAVTGVTNAPFNAIVPNATTCGSPSATSLGAAVGGGGCSCGLAATDTFYGRNAAVATALSLMALASRRRRRATG